MSGPTIVAGQVWILANSERQAIKHATRWTVRYVGRTVVILEGERGAEISLPHEVLRSQYVQYPRPVFTAPTTLLEVESGSGLCYWVSEDSEADLCTTFTHTGRSTVVQDVPQ